MESVSTIDTRTAEIAKVLATQDDVALLRQHLREVIEGESFKGSHRSVRFLQYVIDQVIAGQYDALKERLIGIELFGRDASYDTGSDAIVRVTASDVRRRLLKHYEGRRSASAFRLMLPSGTYIPEITREPLIHKRLFTNETLDTRPTSGQEQILKSDTLPSTGEGTRTGGVGPRVLMIASIVFFLLSGILLFAFWDRPSNTRTAQVSFLPWSAILSSPHATHLITSDPNIAEIQGLTHWHVSVSDYANHKYIPEPNQLTPEEEWFCREILRGDKSATFDTSIALRIAQFAGSDSSKIDTRSARDLQMSDLRTDDNFIFMGSPRSNPWFSLFSDQLDFRFAYDSISSSEIILNTHPFPHEQSKYIATAPGWATGDSYALIAFVQNPDRNGRILLLAGQNGEGTLAAGELVTNSSRLSAALRNCGISTSDQSQNLEMLLHLKTMAGASSNIDMIACHTLPPISAH